MSTSVLLLGNLFIAHKAVSGWHHSSK